MPLLLFILQAATQDCLCAPTTALPGRKGMRNSVRLSWRCTLSRRLSLASRIWQMACDRSRCPVASMHQAVSEPTPPSGAQSRQRAAQDACRRERHTEHSASLPASGGGR